VGQVPIVPVVLPGPMHTWKSRVLSGLKASVVSLIVVKWKTQNAEWTESNSDANNFRPGQFS